MLRPAAGLSSLQRQPLPSCPGYLERSGTRTLVCFTGGGAGYKPVTLDSEGSVGGLAARCKPWSHELMLITLLSSRPDPLCLITGARLSSGASQCAPSGLNGIRMVA